MKFASILCILICSSAAMANPATNMQELLAKRIITLDRPLTTFHYRNATQDPGSMESAVRAVNATTVVFSRKDLSKDHNVVGPGLYVAVDPAATRSYGGANPQLYVITLKKGARILDTRLQMKDFSDPDYDGVTEALQCNGQKILLTPSYDGLRNSPSKDCQAATIDAVKALGVDAILYDYQGSETIDSCRASRGVALNVVSPNAVAENGVSFFSRKTRLESAPGVGDFVHRLFLEGLRDPQLNTFSQMEKNLSDEPDTLKEAMPLQNSSYEALKQAGIWKCGSVRPMEKSIADTALIPARTELLKKFSQVRQEAETAYKKRNFPNYYDFDALRGVVHQRYKNARLAPDDSKFDQWLEFTKLMKNFDTTANLFYQQNIEDFNKNMVKLAEILGEKPVVLTAASIKSFSRDYARVMFPGPKDAILAYVGIMPNLLRKLGFGPRMADIAASDFSLFPMLLPVPHDPEKDYSDFVKKNAAYVTQFLKRCAAIYADTSKTPEEIQAGECGVMNLSTVTVTVTAPQTPVAVVPQKRDPFHQ
jgi:hypothetical protein